MKTLFVSDLDGTLLQEDALISKESCNIINSLEEQGMCFSYATARSVYTSAVVTKGLVCSIPVITKNGVFINEPESGEILLENIFSNDEAADIYHLLHKHKLYPLVFSYQDKDEKYSYDSSNVTEGIQWYLDTHKNDKREQPLKGDKDILSGDVHYFSCIGAREIMEDAYNEIHRKYRCILSKDTYNDMFWLEVMPEHATKADALLQLKEMCGCNYLVVFGDGINDIPMFKVADESYAVQNAVEELKEIATGIIGSNKDDGVAKWLQENYVI